MREPERVIAGQPGPELSAVIVTPDDYETIRETVRCLAAQEVSDRIELVIVAPSADGLGLESGDLGFFRIEVVEVGEIRSSAAARVAGIRRSTAPVVVLTEDHAYPEPGWAEALIESHREPWAAVGPAMLNANPGTVASRAQFVIEYGSWMAPVDAGPCDDLPANHASYKREVLEACGDRLESLLEAGTHLHWHLRGLGHELYLDPRARVRHLNMTQLGSWIRLQYWYGRMFAGDRFPESVARRAIYVCGGPLIPVIRFGRLCRRLLRARPPGRGHPAVLFAAAFGLLVNAAGEIMGYAFGSGNAVVEVARFEWHREQHIAP